MNNELTLLLVEIDGNLLDNKISAEDVIKKKVGTDLAGYANRFYEAYEFFKDEVELWSAETGVRLKLSYKNEGKSDVIADVTITRDIHTRVYAEFSDKTDKAFFRLQMGNFQPAFNVIKDTNDGIWKFQWRYE